MAFLDGCQIWARAVLPWTVSAKRPTARMTQLTFMALLSNNASRGVASDSFLGRSAWPSGMPVPSVGRYVRRKPRIFLGGAIIVVTTGDGFTVQATSSSPSFATNS